MSKINPYDLPTEEERSVRVVLKDITWDKYDDPQEELTLPSKVSVPVDGNLPEIEMVSKAMDLASAAWGYCIVDCCVEPIDYESPKPASNAEDSLSDTLDYVGEIF